MKHVDTTSDEFRIRKLESILFWGMMPLVVGLPIITWVVGSMDYNGMTWILIEDSLVEWLQFLVFLASMVMVLLLAFGQSGLRPKSITQKAATTVLIGLSLLLFFAAGEEISWGQRLLVREASDFFRVHNRQAETNLHNLTVGGVGINKLIFGKLLAVVLIFHNVGAPLLARFKPNWASRWQQLGLYIPTPRMILMYLSGAILALVVQHPRGKELLELGGALHYSATLLLAYGFGLGFSKAAIPPNMQLFVVRFYVGGVYWLVVMATLLALARNIQPISY